MSYNFSDIQKALLCRYTTKKIVSYVTRSKTKYTICAVMARASTGVITSPGVSPADLGTFLVFDNGIHVDVLAITSSTGTRTAVTTS